MLCRLDGSRGPAAAAQRLRLPVLGGKYGPGKLSDAKGQAHSSLLSSCTAAQAASVEAPIEVPAGDVDSVKLSQVRAMLTQAFARQGLEFTGPVLVKANKSESLLDCILK